MIEYYDRLFHPSCDDYLFTEDEIVTIDSPSLVFWTDQNPFHGPDAAERLQELISGASIHIMKGAAHWPQWEKPEEHDDVVLSFLNS